MEWNVKTDSFGFEIKLKERPDTRRGLLSTIHSIFDPLGFLAPVVITGKLMLQELTRLKYDWDTPIPEQMRARWQTWKATLKGLEVIQIPRWVKRGHVEDTKLVCVHHFSDASSKGYGQCSYIQFVTSSGESVCTLLAAKCRVTPLKTLSIPRLELMAAVLSITMSRLLHKELTCQIDKEHFWTDSKVVLGYIRNDMKRFKVFVANRVQLIRTYSEPEQWQFVSTSENPADCLSRGLLPEQLRDYKEWWHGPDLIKENRVEADPQSEIEVLEEDPEVIRGISHHIATKETCLDLSRLDRFASWNDARRAIAWCLRYKDCLKKKKQTGKLSVNEIDKAGARQTRYK